jgi:hypothetical protein
VIAHGEHQLVPVSASASPPPGIWLSAVSVISTAATTSATPMPRWMLAFGQPATIDAPIHEPPTADRMSTASVSKPTATMVM